MSAMPGLQATWDASMKHPRSHPGRSCGHGVALRRQQRSGSAASHSRGGAQRLALRCTAAPAGEEEGVRDAAGAVTKARSDVAVTLKEPRSDVVDEFWKWRGYDIRYQSAGSAGPPIVLVHGFGGNCDHWRKNILPLSEAHRVYAIDLLGYGYSSKPDPKVADPNLPLSSPYKFETWGQQLNDFIAEVVGSPAFLICNSVGGVAGLQAAVSNPALTRGVALLNVSLRMLHVSKQSPLARPAVSLLQHVLRTTDLGRVFFRQVATPRAVGNILRECYSDPTTVTPDLVEAILKPGLEPGAVDVFLDFICYSGGPLPEELIPLARCPVTIGWGTDDPWEPVKMGREFAKFETVEEFVEFPGVGHCPQDEAPHVVNPFVAAFVARHA